MSDSPRPTGPSFNPAWLLVLLIPAGLVAGRLLGNLPVPAAPTAPAAVVPAPPVPDAGLPAPNPAGGPVVTQEAPDEPPATGGSFRWRTLGEAVAESRATGRPVLLDFNADWCPPCQRMKREAFENAAIARAIEAAVIPVSMVDRTRETGSNPPDVADLQERFRIEAFPTLVVLAPETGRSVAQKGYGGPEATRDWILQAAQQVR